MTAYDPHYPPLTLSAMNLHLYVSTDEHREIICFAFKGNRILGEYFLE